MSVTSLKSVRNMTPIESADDLSFVHEVAQSTTGSQNVKVSRPLGGNDARSQLHDGPELGKQLHDGPELGKQLHDFTDSVPRSVVQVKSTKADDLDDLYDFDYVNLNENDNISSRPANEPNGIDGLEDNRENVDSRLGGTLQDDVLLLHTSTDDLNDDEMDDVIDDVNNDALTKNDSDKFVHHRSDVKNHVHFQLDSTSVVHVESHSKNHVHFELDSRELDSVLNEDTESLQSYRQADQSAKESGANEVLNRQFSTESGDSETDVDSSSGTLSERDEQNLGSPKQKHKTKYISDSDQQSNVHVTERQNFEDNSSDVSQDAQVPHQSLVQTEKGALNFEDSVESSYFAMFKSSETDKDNSKVKAGAGKEIITPQTPNRVSTLTIETANTVDGVSVGPDNIDEGKDIDDGVSENTAEDHQGRITLSDVHEIKTDAETKNSSHADEQITQSTDPQSNQVNEKPEDVKSNIPNQERNPRYEDAENPDDVSLVLDNDFKHTAERSSARTQKSYASAKSSSSHKSQAPHRPIEEMKAADRLKYAPYAESLARGYSKQVNASKQQNNAKHKRHVQPKPETEPQTGKESAQGHPKAKTEEASPQKKEQNPRSRFEKTSSAQKQNHAPKGKKQLVKQRQTKSSAATMNSNKKKDENMNEIKESNEELQNKDQAEDHMVQNKETILVSEEAKSKAEIIAPVKPDEISSAIVSKVPDKPEDVLENVAPSDNTGDCKQEEGIKEESQAEHSTNLLSSPKNQAEIKVERNQEEITPLLNDNNQETINKETNVPVKNNQETINKETNLPVKNNPENSNKKKTSSKNPKEIEATTTDKEEQKDSGIKSWFGSKKKKKPQKVNASDKIKNGVTPRSTVSVNGIIITTTSEDSPKTDQSRQENKTTSVPAALTIVDETKSDPHGKAGRVVLANIKQKLKDSSLSGSINSTSALPVNQRSRSPSPETSFSSNGSKLGKIAHKTQSMSSLQVPGALTTPRDSSQDDDNISISSRRDSTSRRSVDYRIQNATAVMVPEAADEKPKSVLTNDETFIKNAIPYLPLSLAIACLLLNIVIPGSGTALSGLSILCCGQARVSNKNDQILTTLCANCLVGLAQLFTVTFLLVGWFWSIGWGIQMVSLSVQHREEMKKLRAKELQALALSAFGSPKRGAPFGP
nr:hypothetical protein BgiMline_022743 [Biomphalaria glabrata]